MLMLLRVDGSLDGLHVVGVHVDEHVVSVHVDVVASEDVVVNSASLIPSNSDLA